jgi:type IV secretory pathway VirB10-like protein
VYLAVHDSLHERKRREHRRFLAGVGVSVTVHILLMLAYRTTGPAPAPAVPEPPSFITVRIAPPPPRAEPATRQRSAAPAARSARKSTPQAVIAVPVSPQQEDAPDAFTVQQADEPAPGEAPQFDMNTAKQTARQLAGQTKLGREGHANAQFPDPPLETESKLGKAISRAKRRNCKDGVPGGLLAPLFLAMDKKNHGCKW